MSELTQILNQLEELTKRVAALEAELANKANKPIFCGPNPIAPTWTDGPDSYWSPVFDIPQTTIGLTIGDNVSPLTIGEGVAPLTIGENIHGLAVGENVFPFTFEKITPQRDWTTELTEALHKYPLPEQKEIEEYKKKRDGLLQKWRDNPDSVPTYTD